jgi:hypothetical protein
VFKEVLVSPKGREVTVTSAGDYNDLRYGKGYKEKLDPPVVVKADKVPEKPERKTTPKAPEPDPK